MKTWFVVLMLVVLFPVGLFLMWKYTEWNKVVKIIVTVVLAVTVIACIGDSESNPEASEESLLPTEMIGQTVFEAEDTIAAIDVPVNYYYEDKDENYNKILKDNEQAQKIMVIVDVVEDEHENVKDDAIAIIIKSSDEIEKEKAEANLENKLSQTTVTVMVNECGDASCKYGFKLKDYRIELNDENSWKEYGTCEVTNAFNATATHSFEAVISGTDENPEVVSFAILD